MTPCLASNWILNCYLCLFSARVMSLVNKTDPDWVVLGNDAGPAGLQRSRSASPLTWHPEIFSIMCWLIDTPEEWFEDLVVQLAGYAREVFASQPTRHFLHGFTVRDSRMELWMFGRSGPFSSWWESGCSQRQPAFSDISTDADTSSRHSM